MNMLNIFNKKESAGDELKKIEESAQKPLTNPGSNSEPKSVIVPESSNKPSQSSSLDPPKTLPELAKDMYEETKEYKKPTLTFDIDKQMPDKQLDNEIPKTPIEPVHAHIPKLDLNLLKEYRQRLELEKNKAEEQPKETAAEKVEPRYEYKREPINMNIMNQLQMHPDSRFYTYIEKLILSGNIELAHNLLLNSLNQMNMYHKNKSLYGTLEELKKLEEFWIYINNKLDSMNFFAAGINNDLETKSRELAQYIYSAKTDTIAEKSVSDAIPNIYSNGSNVDAAKMQSFNQSEAILQEPEKRSSILNNDFLQIIKNPRINPNFIVEDSSKFFYFSNNKHARSLNELINIIIEIPDEVFNYHVNSNKNDFSNWINDVLALKNVAEKIMPIMNRHELISILLSYIDVR